MKKTLLLIIITIPSLLISQNNNRIENALNEVRGELGQKDFKVDTLMSRAINRLSQKKILDNNMDAGDSSEIRDFLRENGIYDYNFKMVEVRVPKRKEIDLVQIAGKNERLQKVLDDTLYNRVGYISFKNGRSTTLIFTKNQISFLEPIQIIKQNWQFPEGEETIVGNKLHYLVIRGYNNSDDSVFFSIDNKNANSIQNTEIVYDKNNTNKNYFEIKLENPGKYEDINFFDSKRNIISVFRTPYYDKSENKLKYPRSFNPFNIKE